MRFFDSMAGQSPANVTYKPLTSEFDREAWELADLGDPWARYVAAHEICHIFVTIAGRSHNQVLYKNGLISRSSLLSGKPTRLQTIS